MEMITKIGEFLASSQNIYLFLAVTGSFVFGIQFLMMLFGGDFGVDHDGGSPDIDSMEMGDHDTIAELSFFSVKSIIAFFTFFGWAGYFWGHKGWSGLFIAIACGAMMMFIVTFLIYLMLKMQHSGNISHDDLIGQSASVYLGIPGGRSGSGRITATVKGRTREVKAMSDEELPRGTPVMIKAHIDGDCYLVEKITEESAPPKYCKVNMSQDNKK